MDADWFLALLDVDRTTPAGVVERAYQSMRDRIRDGAADGLPPLAELDRGIAVYRVWRDLFRMLGVCSPVVVSDRSGTAYTVRLQPDESQATAGPVPDELPLHVLVGCDDRTLGKVAGRARKRGVDYFPARYGPGAHSAVALLGVSRQEALQLAGAHEVPALLTWDAEAVTYTDTAGGATARQSWSCTTSGEAVRHVPAELNRARRERRLETRVGKETEQRDRAELDERITAGWPKSWPLHLMRQWEQRGGSPDSAAAFDDAGWTSDELSTALQGTAPFDPATATPPELDAHFHHGFGDMLDDIVSGNWPPCDESTVLSLKRTALDGRRERELVKRAPAGLVWEHHTRGSGGRWVLEWANNWAGDVVGLLAANAALTTLETGVIHEYCSEASQLPTDVLVALLRGVEPGASEDPSQWPDDIAEKWAFPDFDVISASPAVPWVDRWCGVNGERVFLVQGGSEIFPVTVDREEIPSWQVALVGSAGPGCWCVISGHRGH